MYKVSPIDRHLYSLPKYCVSVEKKCYCTKKGSVFLAMVPPRLFFTSVSLAMPSPAVSHGTAVARKHKISVIDEDIMIHAVKGDGYSRGG